MVFSIGKIQRKEILFPQRQRLWLQTRQCSWVSEHPKFAIALRWSCPNISTYKLLKEDCKIIKHRKNQTSP